MLPRFANPASLQIPLKELFGEFIKSNSKEDLIHYLFYKILFK